MWWILSSRQLPSIRCSFSIIIFGFSTTNLDPRLPIEVSFWILFIILDTDLFVCLVLGSGIKSAGT